MTRRGVRKLGIPWARETTFGIREAASSMALMGDSSNCSEGGVLGRKLMVNINVMVMDSYTISFRDGNYLVSADKLQDNERSS